MAYSGVCNIKGTAWSQAIIMHKHSNLRMKKEMVSKVNSVAGEFRKVSDLQMVETTKRTIRENVTISQQLGKMSEKTMALLRENEALHVKETELSRRVELLDTSLREVTRRNVSNQKVWGLFRGGGARAFCSLWTP